MRRAGPSFLALFLLAVPAARALDLRAVLEKMKEGETAVQAMSFDFTQTAFIRATGEKQKIRGSAFFSRPDKFRVEHKAPVPQTVVSDGKTLWFYNPSRNQVFTESWENWARSAGFPQGLTPFQMSPDEMEKKYAVALEGRQNEKGRDGAVLKLTPRDPGPWPYGFRVWIDLKNGLPYKTELESQSVQASVEVTRMKVNPSLPPETFRFDAPAGAEVLGSPLQ